MGYIEYDFDYYGPAFGSAHSVSEGASEPDAVELLRQVVEEVTRRPVPREVKRIGFY